MRITQARLGLIAFVVVGITVACSNSAAFAQAAERYQNFNSAIYIPIDDMRRMAANPKFMQESYDLIHSYIPGC
jgi:hypothetical protein